MHSASRIVRDQDDFHILIYPNLADTAPNQVPLCKNSQFNLKIPIKGLFSPLKIKLEFLSCLSNESVSKKERSTLKGNLDIYVSRFHPNP